MRDRRLALASLVLGVVLLVAAAGAALVLFNRQPYRVVAGPPILVTADRGPSSIIEAHNTPSLAVDPTRPGHLVLAEKVDRPRFGCHVHVSEDGGRTWAESQLPLPPDRDTCFVPDLAFLGSSVYLVYLTLNTHPHDPLSGGNDPNGMYLERSQDGGRTFGQPMKLPGGDNLQPRLAADPHAGRLYVVYVRGSPLQNDTPLGLGPPPNPIVAISSSDGGASFSAPVQVNDGSRARVGAATPMVGPRGDLFVLYEDYRRDLDDYHNWSVPFRGTFALVLARSRDGGLTFSESVVEPAQVRPHRFLVYTPPFPALAMSPDGSSIYAGWSDGRDGAPDVLFRRSPDGGSSWSTPLKLNARSENTRANFDLPALSAPSRERVEAVWYAFTGSRPTAHVEFAYSTDGGQRFYAPAVISPAFDGSFGVPSPRDLGSTDFGSRLALATPRGGPSLVAWSDSSRGSKDTGREDVYVAELNLR